MSSLVNAKGHLARKFRPPAWTKDLTPKQKRVFNAPARFKRALAGRQSGKSHVCAAWLLGGGKGENSLAFARTKEQVLGIYLEPFYELNERYGLELDISASKGQVVERSGHTIHLFGIRDAASAEKFRGQRFRRVVADEMGTYKHELIRWIVQSVLQPTLLKKAGDMLCVGTPGVIPEGFWYEMCTGFKQPDDTFLPPWPVDFGAEGWTLRDNPFLPNVEQFIADILKANGWTESTPTFAREYLAKWVRDMGGLIYQFDNVWHDAPDVGTTVLGVDIGFDDGCGYVVCRMGQRPFVHVIRAFTETQSLPQDIQATVARLVREHNVNHIIGDTGGSGKGIIEMLAANFRIPVTSAKADGSEQNKRPNIDFVRGMLANGNLRLCRAHNGHSGAKELAQEWSVLPWDEKRTKHSDGFQDELSDALIYALKVFLQTPGSRGSVDVPDPVSLESARRKRAAEASARKNARQRWKGSAGGLWIPEHEWKIAA